MTLERRGHDDIPSQCQTASGGVVTVTGGPAVPVAAAFPVTVVIRASASLGGPPSGRKPTVSGPGRVPQWAAADSDRWSWLPNGRA